MYKLLIVDDDYEIRNGLCKYFPWSSIGFEVVGVAENGKEAYEIIKNKQDIDVILCDIRMPIMSGIDLATELSINYSQINVVFFTAYKEFDYAQKALETGVKRYILKSTNYNELIRAFTTIKQEMDQKAGIFPVRTEQEIGSNFNEKIIQRIKDHVEKEYKNITLDDLAKLVHMNPDYLSKYFKKHTGTRFSEYLIQIRMGKAALFLDQIHYKTYEISEMVGYSNSFNFTRAFKNYYGMTPRDYRKQEHSD